MERKLLELFNKEIEKIALEYQKLSVISDLSEWQKERMGEILELAIDYPDLDFLINEIDHQNGKLLNILDEENCKSYKNQQALLREYLGCDINNFSSSYDNDHSSPKIRSSTFTKKNI